MIYGVTAFINDCNFRLTNLHSRIEERYSFQAFFTNLQAAKETYEVQLRKFNNEKSISYRGRDQRGKCELYKAHVNQGRIMTHGETISLEQIQ